MAMTRGAALAIASVLAAAFLAGCATASPRESGVSYAVFKHSCCEGSDVKQTWHPGSTIQLHWMIKEAGRTSSNKPTPVTLSAALSGQYGDVARLKADAVIGGTGASQMVPASIIATDDRNPVAPVSTFALSPDLPPGFYNLTLKVDFGGGNSWSMGSIVQVGP